MTPVSPMAGPFIAASGLLGVAGALKVWRPAATAEALRAAGLPGSGAHGPLGLEGVGRLVGAVELAVAAGALLIGGRPAAAMVASAYLAFAIFTARLVHTAGAGASCGCFGAEESPASTLHVWVNSVVATLVIVAAVQDVPPLRSVLVDQPLAGLPFLLTTLVGGWLLFVILTVVPDLRLAMADGREPR